MHGRKRFAFVAMPLLGLLAALLLGWSVAAAQVGDPLTLTITAERAQCTAGTLNPVSWEISGGTPPYRLTVAGEAVDADAESATVTCGALPEGASTAPGTITATVTDATGAPATASAAYTIVPPLPAPSGLTLFQVLPYQVTLNWAAVEGAGSQSPAVQNDRGRDEFDSYLFRYRDAEAETTAEYEVVGPLRYPFTDVRPGPLDALLRPTTTGDYLGMVAAIRHPIEQETPAALNWSAAVPFGVVRAPENIAVQATHDTLEVSWDEQPYTQGAAVVRLVGGGIHQGRGPSGTTYADGRYHTRFRHLTPDSEYEITISIGADRAAIYSETTARTLPAPADWEPLPRGPQNLRVTTTHDSIIVRWDPPFPEAPYWFVSVSTIFNGTAWSVEQRTIGTPPPEGVTLRGDPPWLIRPNTTYSVLVAHDGFDGATAEVSVTTPAAPPALRLTLTAGRDECTAGTLNPVTWEISGGTPPYTLTVAGETVDADAEGATVTCGALPDYGLWLPVTQAPGTITATVTDATGAPATASAAYTIVPPLPAPTAVGIDAMRTAFQAVWDRVPAAGSVPTLAQDCPCPLYLLRWRPSGTTSWTTALYADRGSVSQGGTAYYFEGVLEGTSYQCSIATLRDAIEQQTPTALTWSPPVTAATVAPATGVRATTTHDTITVTWDAQPTTAYFTIGLSGPRGAVSQRFTPDGSTPHQVVFRDLPPGTEYTADVTVEVGHQSPLTAITASTTAAPSGWTPLLRGPQNLRTAVTHNSATVTWDAPYAGARDLYTVSVFEGEKEVGYAITSGGVTAHTFTGLTPATSYRVEVTHVDIVYETATVTVTTAAAPTSAQSTRPVITCTEITPGWRICWTPGVTPG